MTRTVPAHPALHGVVASLTLFVVYVSVLTLVSGRPYMLDKLGEDAPFLVFLVPSFGAQVGLWVHLRRKVRRQRAANATTGACGGVSGTAMVACCAHYLPTILPLIGVSALATTLMAVRTPLLIIAIAANFAGIGWIWRAIRRLRTTPAPVKGAS